MMHFLASAFQSRFGLSACAWGNLRRWREKRRTVGVVERGCVSKAFPIKIPDKAIWQHCHMLDMPAAGRAWQKRGPAGLKRPAGPARKSAAKMGEKGRVK